MIFQEFQKSNLRKKQGIYFIFYKTIFRFGCAPRASLQFSQLVPGPGTYNVESRITKVGAIIPKAVRDT